ncbi:MAG: hypothetical protein HKN50_06995 [Gammaproteobacteria bacterium]|nr:hypothetical protein [Gammaproteobacteria bacterium]
MKYLLRIALSIGVSFAILALLLQGVSTGVADDQRPGVLAALQNTTWGLVLAYLGLYLVTLVIRAYRYQLLLRVSGEVNVPNMRQMALVTGVRNMTVDMLPARLGELGYVGLLNRGYGVKLHHCVSSLGLSIAFDLLALLAIVLLIMLSQLFGTGLQPWAVAALVSAVIIAAVAFVGLFAIVPRVNDWIQQRWGKASESESVAGKFLNFVAAFSDSVETAGRAGKTGVILALSVLIRLLKYAGFYILFLAVAVPSFTELSGLPMAQVVSALIGGEVGASLPIPTFMSFGAYEAGSALVFKLLGVADQAAAVITMLGVHIWSQLVEYLIGGALLALYILMRRRAKADAAGKARSPLMRWSWMAGATAVFVAGSGFLAWELRAAKKLGALAAPAAGEVSADENEWRELSKQHVSSINGFVVFSSNRDGNHDIFKLELSDYSLSKLTEHPHTETYPRISPDGSKLVFARAHQPWVSQRNTVAWDVYLKDLRTGAETKIGENATAPHWVDAQNVSFLQGGTSVVKVSVDDLSSTTVFESGLGNALPKGARIQNPKLNPLTGELAFTGRQNQIGINSGHWGTAITTEQGHTGLYNGCEIGWTSDGRGLYQVNPGGKFNDLQIIRIDPDTLETSTLIDLEGEFSHEYWPKDSANGEYMVFGASRGQQFHEHDTEDYEIFLWKMGSDPARATRLTFHTGNDNWPDIYIRPE